MEERKQGKRKETDVTILERPLRLLPRELAREGEGEEERGVGPGNLNRVEGTGG